MKQSKIKIAITGGIGSGKSTVAKIISQSGYPVFSCDEIARNIFEEEFVVKQLSENFPSCVINGIPDRKKIADIVFSDREKLKILENITHPAIMQILDNKMQSVQERLVFAEVPLLFEGGYQNKFDKVIVVLRDLEKRIKATCERDGETFEKVERRINNQFNYENKVIFEHTVIYNDADLQTLRRKVKCVLNEFENL